MKKFYSMSGECRAQDEESYIAKAAHYGSTPEQAHAAEMMLVILAQCPVYPEAPNHMLKLHNAVWQAAHPELFKSKPWVVRANCESGFWNIKRVFSTYFEAREFADALGGGEEDDILVFVEEVKYQEGEEE